MSREGTAPVLRTARLTLAPAEESDVAELLGVFRDPEVRRHLLDDRVVTRAWVASEVAESRRRFRSVGQGLWCARRNGHAEIIGFFGYRPFHEPPELQLLCGMLPEWWGQGLATEACREAMRHGMDVLGLRRIRAETDADNERSIRLMQRLGMTFLERRVRSGGGTFCYVFGDAG